MTVCKQQLQRFVKAVFNKRHIFKYEEHLEHDGRVSAPASLLGLSVSADCSEADVTF